MTVVALTSMPAASALTGPEIFYAQQSSADKQVTATQIRAFTSVGAAVNCPTASNPTLTASGTVVMMGLGTTSFGPAASITPIRSGIVFFHVIGNMLNSGAFSTFGNLRYGTGAAPTNGAASTGTGVTDSISTSNNVSFPFCLAGVVTGLALNTAVWFDIGLSASGGNASILNVTSTAFEL